MAVQFRFLLLTILGFTIASPATACLWDYDTLPSERGRFPSALELITGKFLRHSPEFYQWRIEDRSRKLKADPDNAGYYDDLGVAYLKTGQIEKAIAILEEKEKIWPGLYETYANLGTVYILAGNFEKGLPLIDKALAINPNAHFGREKYQKWLVEYAITKRRDGKLQFPMRQTEPPPHLPDKDGFDAYLTANAVSSTEALPAVLGMMRFANHENPLLLEALGDLLVQGGDAKQLASLAYLRAADQMPDVDSRLAYRKLAEAALQGQADGVASQMPLAKVEAILSADLADADEWYADLKRQELSWIQEGKDADVEFSRVYYQEPKSPGRTWEFYLLTQGAGGRIAIMALTLLGALVGFLLLIYLRYLFLNRRSEQNSITARDNESESPQHPL